MFRDDFANDVATALQTAPHEGGTWQAVFEADEGLQLVPGSSLHTILEDVRVFRHPYYGREKPKGFLDPPSFALVFTPRGMLDSLCDGELANKLGVIFGPLHFTELFAPYHAGFDAFGLTARRFVSEYSPVFDMRGHIDGMLAFEAAYGYRFFPPDHYEARYATQRTVAVEREILQSQYERDRARWEACGSYPDEPAEPDFDSVTGYRLPEWAIAFRAAPLFRPWLSDDDSARGRARQLKYLDALSRTQRGRLDNAEYWSRYHELVTNGTWEKREFFESYGSPPDTLGKYA